jgi:light-regulated signal transduction histidine kinase (bacteriophytochrome)
MNDLLRAELPLDIADLTACDREPIQFPGANEPNGAMLVLGEDALTILQASSNILPFLNMAPELQSQAESAFVFLGGAARAKLGRMNAVLNLLPY